MNERGFVVVDGAMRTNVVDIYAIGDIASFPSNVAFSQNMNAMTNVNIQHYKIAQIHGKLLINFVYKQYPCLLGSAKICAQSIMGMSRQSAAPFVTFFWTLFFGKSIRYCGMLTPDSMVYTEIMSSDTFRNCRR